VYSGRRGRHISCKQMIISRNSTLNVLNCVNWFIFGATHANDSRIVSCCIVQSVIRPKLYRFEKSEVQRKFSRNLQITLKV